jgi:DNA-binding NarL/FixJ family response regulator
VLAAVADGMTTLEIADRLCLSSSTVKTHLDHILSKTGTEHRAAAVAAALRAGWLS